MDKTDPRSVRQFLRSQLPEEAFKATPKTMLVPVVHVAVVIACIVMIAATDNYLAILLLSIVAGHSMFCTANFGHYLSHKSIIKAKPWCYLSEVFLWATNMSSATVWMQAHNKYHHKYTNGEKDTFRYFAKDELNPTRSFVHKLISPNRDYKYNPLVFLTYLVTHAEYFNASLTGREGKNSNIVPFLPSYAPGDKKKIVFELIVIVALQVGVYFLMGAEWQKYLTFTLVSIFVSSAVASVYLFTQHNLYDLSNENDPLRNSTSLIVPGWIDKMHLYVSHHVEHHIFAGMAPGYLPQVRALLARHYPELYMCVKIGDIWPQIYETDEYKEFDQANSESDDLSLNTLLELEPHAEVSSVG